MLFLVWKGSWISSKRGKFSSRICCAKRHKTETFTKNRLWPLHSRTLKVVSMRCGDFKDSDFEDPRVRLKASPIKGHILTKKKQILKFSSKIWIKLFTTLAWKLTNSVLVQLNAQRYRWIGCSKDFFHYYSIKGLKLAIDIERPEYFEELSEDAGAIITVTPEGHLPFPDDSGVSVMPGRTTFIGLRKVSLIWRKMFVMT